MKKSVLFVLFAVAIISCESEKNKTPEYDQSGFNVGGIESYFNGNYVTEEYFRRSEGYDWMVVTVDMVNEKLAEIIIRSRADKKKPSCTFYSKAIVKGKDTLAAEYEGKIIIFTFSDSSVTINTASEEDNSILYYFCSGGGSIGGTYKKISDDLDTSQLETVGFAESLKYNDIAFKVEASNSFLNSELSLVSKGLKIKELSETLKIEGNVYRAEVGDLNIDGWPEIYIYIHSQGSGAYGDVICYSVIEGESAARVDFPKLSEEQAVRLGYMGHDEFAIVETTLVRRFPIYKENDNKSETSGGTRQLQYKLKGEVNPEFIIDKILEY